MEERVREVFFSLLKSALWGGKLDIEVGDVSRKELGRVVMMAKSQTVLGLIAHEILPFSGDVFLRHQLLPRGESENLK